MPTSIMTISLLTIFSTSFMLALSGALMPGPMLTVTISETPRKGPLTGPLLILGHGIAEIILILALIVGLAPFLQNQLVSTIIFLFGGSFLIYMGASMLRSIPELSLTGQETGSPSKNIILSGFLYSAANPYWIIWWGTIGLGYIVYSKQFGTIGLITFFIGHILADFAWYSFISVGLHKGKHLLQDKHYKILIGICGIFLLFLAITFIYKGLTSSL